MPGMPERRTHSGTSMFAAFNIAYGILVSAGCKEPPSRGWPVRLGGELRTDGVPASQQRSPILQPRAWGIQLPTVTTVVVVRGR